MSQLPIYMFVYFKLEQKRDGNTTINSTACVEIETVINYIYYICVYEKYTRNTFCMFGIAAATV